MKMNTAVIYCRFSPRPRAEDDLSNDKQAERCRAYCAAFGWDVLDVLEDAALSGEHADNRPGLQAAVKLATTRKAALVVYDLSRLTRDIIDGAAIERKLRRRGASLVSITEHIDCSHYTGRLVYHVLLGIAQMERERIAERTKKAMLKYQAEGRRMSKEPPFGYVTDKADPARLVKDEREQAIIRLVLQWREEGLSYRDIAAKLLADGYKPRKGEKWHMRTISRIIKRSQ